MFAKIIKDKRHIKVPEFASGNSVTIYAENLSLAMGETGEVLLNKFLKETLDYEPTLEEIKEKGRCDTSASLGVDGNIDHWTAGQTITFSWEDKPVVKVTLEHRGTTMYRVKGEFL